MLTFEEIQSQSLTRKFGALPHQLSRAKILGGWLVETPNGLCFIPDPEHRWNGNSLS
jgi:hypothetical protein